MAKYIKGPPDSWLIGNRETVSGGMGPDAESNPYSAAGNVTFGINPPAGLGTYCRKAVVDEKSFPLFVGDHKWQVTLCKDNVKGLSNHSLEPDTGLLFDLTGNLTKVPINMQEMHYPLDIIFITQSEIVTKVLRDVLPEADITYTGYPVRYFLEVNADEATGVKAGSKVKVDLAGLKNIFLKSKVYLQPNEMPPKGALVRTGKEGGRFYEATGKEVHTTYRGKEITLIDLKEHPMVLEAFKIFSPEEQQEFNKHIRHIAMIFNKHDTSPKAESIGDGVIGINIDEFQKINSPLRAAILYHELYHQIHGHEDNAQKATGNERRRLIAQQEIETANAVMTWLKSKRKLFPNLNFESAINSQRRYAGRFNASLHPLFRKNIIEEIDNLLEKSKKIESYYIHTEYKPNLDKLTSKYFSNFNIARNEGYYKGKEEPSATIEIINPDDYSKIEALAEDIKKINDQEEVLITDIEETELEKSMLLKQIDRLIKAGTKVYLEPQETAPKGTIVQVGPEGGRYYTTQDKTELEGDTEFQHFGKDKFYYGTKNVYGSVALDNDKKIATIAHTSVYGDEARKDWKGTYTKLIKDLIARSPLDYKIYISTSGTGEEQAYCEDLVNKGIATRLNSDVYDLDKTFTPKTVDETTILDRVNTSYISLRSDSEHFKVNGKDIWIGHGTSYFPPGGGSSYDSDGMVVIGPPEWTGKKLWDIPEVKASIMKEYEDSLHFSGGDFQKIGQPKNMNILNNILYRYKSPIAEDQSYLNVLAKAYFANSKVPDFDKESMIEQEKKYNEEMEKYGVKSTTRIDKDAFGTLLYALHDNRYEGEKVTQEAVNEFAYVIKQTQEELKKKFKTDKIMLYRGIAGDYAKKIKKSIQKDGKAEIEVNPATSWSSSKRTAEDFASGKAYGNETHVGVVLKKEVPIEDVLFSYLTSEELRPEQTALFGGTAEYEFIVGSHENKVVITKDDIEEMV